MPTSHTHVLIALDNHAKQKISIILLQAVSHIKQQCNEIIFSALYDSMHKDASYNILHSEPALRKIYTALLAIRATTITALGWAGTIQHKQPGQESVFEPLPPLSWNTVSEKHNQYINSNRFTEKYTHQWPEEMAELILTALDGQPEVVRTLLADYFFSPQLNAILEGMTLYCDTAEKKQHLSPDQISKTQDLVDLMNVLKASLKASTSAILNKKHYTHYTWKPVLLHNKNQLIFPERNVIPGHGTYQSLQNALYNNAFSLTDCQPLQHYFNEHALTTIQNMTTYHTHQSQFTFPYTDSVRRFSIHNHTHHPKVIATKHLQNTQKQSITHAIINTFKDAAHDTGDNNTTLATDTSLTPLQKRQINLNLYISNFVEQQVKLVTQSKRVVTLSTLIGLLLIILGSLLSLLETVALYHRHLPVFNLTIFSSSTAASIIYGIAVGLLFLGITALCIRLFRQSFKRMYQQKQQHTYSSLQSIFNQATYLNPPLSPTSENKKISSLKVHTPSRNGYLHGPLHIENMDSTAVEPSQSPVPQSSHRGRQLTSSTLFSPMVRHYNSNNQYVHPSGPYSGYQPREKLNRYGDNLTAYFTKKKRLSYSKSDTGRRYLNDTPSVQKQRKHFIEHQRLNNENSINRIFNQRSNAVVKTNPGLISNFSSGSSSTNNSQEDQPLRPLSVINSNSHNRSDNSTGTVQFHIDNPDNIHVNMNYPSNNENSPDREDTEDSGEMVYTTNYQM